MILDYSPIILSANIRTEQAVNLSNFNPAEDTSPSPTLIKSAERLWTLIVNKAK